MATGFLQDLIDSGHLSPDLSYLACDPEKLRRARQVAMNQAKEKDKERGEGEKIIGLAYDGRKDNTRVMVPDSRGKLHVRVIKEEHISVTEEPSGSYLSHFTPDPPV